MISPAAKAMPMAARPETVARMIPFRSRNNFMPASLSAEDHYAAPIARRHHGHNLGWTSAELCIHDRKPVGVLDIVDLGDAQDGGKNFRRDFHGAGFGGAARRRLRK